MLRNSFMANKLGITIIQRATLASALILLLSAPALVNGGPKDAPGKTPHPSATTITVKKDKSAGIGGYGVILEKNIFGFITTETAAATPPPVNPLPVVISIPPLPAPAAAEPSQASKLKEKLSLTGVVEIGATRKAMIQDTETGDGYYVAAGEEVAGAHVIDINASGATLEIDGEKFTLDIGGGKQPAATEEETPAPQKDDEEKKTTPDMLPFPQRGRIGGMPVIQNSPAAADSNVPAPEVKKNMPANETQQQPADNTEKSRSESGYEMMH